MSERPIIFNDAMARAVRDGTKTVTRRPVKSPAKNMQREGMQVIKRREPGDAWYGDYVWSMRDWMGVWGDYTEEQFLALCPYGEPGDVLYVREAWGLHRWFDHTDWLRGSVRGLSEGYLRSDYALAYRSDVDSDGAYWRPSIHMPRWASRILLRVTSVRVERIQAITEDGARAEGVLPVPFCRSGRPDGLEHVESFEGLWDGIYSNKGLGWEANPWVWVVEFERLKDYRGEDGGHD